MRVEGLNYTEARQLTERLGEAGERLPDRDITEFTLPSWMLLNALETIGYSVLPGLNFIFPDTYKNVDAMFSKFPKSPP